jgi:hypothetical protein
MQYDEKFFQSATAAELRQFKRTLNLEEVTESQLEALDDLIIERAVEEKYTKLTTAQEKKAKAKQMDEQAYKNWPELKDEESEFYKAVDTYMGEHGLDREDSLLAAANAVGLDMGLQPAGRRDAGGDPMGKIKPAKPTGATKKVEDEFLSKTADVRRDLANLIPVGDEDFLERVAARAEADQGEE